MTDDKTKAVVITGPTASGKSSLAVDLALRFGGEIVNADSMQVYRGMDVGTAKPTIAERKGIPHHLLDVVDPDEDFDTAKYRSLAIPQLRDMACRQKPCFIVGGTGLYIKTLLGGLLKSPPGDPELRKELHRVWEEGDPISLHERLKTLDPQAARKIHPHDRVRVIRALEVIHLTSQPLSSLIQRHGFRDKPFRTLKICLQVDRQELYGRINARSLAMIDAGLVGETEGLLNRGYSPELKPMKSLGYRHMVKFLRGDCKLDEVIHELQRDTRRYAKRQLTWFGSDPEMVWMKPEDREAIVEKIEAFHKDTP